MLVYVRLRKEGFIITIGNEEIGTFPTKEEVKKLLTNERRGLNVLIVEAGLQRARRGHLTSRMASGGINITIFTELKLKLNDKNYIPAKHGQKLPRITEIPNELSNS